MPGSRRAENNERVATYAQNFEVAPRASVTTRGKQREGRHLRPEFRGRSTRQRHDAPQTTKSPFTPRISRPRASDTTRRKQREGRHLRPEFRGRSTRQRHDARKTTIGSPLTPRISQKIHAPASTHRKLREGRHLRPEFRRRYTRQRHDTRKTTRGSPLTPRSSRTLHAPASRRASNNERVATYAQNFEDAPRASVTTRGKQREGRHLRPEFRRRSTRQRHVAPETARGSPLTPRISRTLHAPASRHASNNERVATYAQNFKNAPRASVTTRRKQREGRHLRPEFRGCSTRRPTDRPTGRPTDRPFPF